MDGNIDSTGQERGVPWLGPDDGVIGDRECLQCFVKSPHFNCNNMVIFPEQERAIFRKSSRGINKSQAGFCITGNVTCGLAMVK